MANRKKGQPTGMPFDVGAFNAAYERNLNAWMAASKMMADGIQAAAERHMKFTQDMAGEMMETFDITKSPGEFDLNQYMTRLQERVDTMVAEAREVQEIVVKAQTSALHTMYESLTENLEQAGVPSETIAAAVNDAMTRAEAVVESVSAQMKPAATSGHAYSAPSEAAATAAPASPKPSPEAKPAAPAAAKPAATKSTAAKPAASSSSAAKPADEAAPAAPKPRTRRTRTSTSGSPSSSGSN